MTRTTYWTRQTQKLISREPIIWFHKHQLFENAKHRLIEILHGYAAKPPCGPTQKPRFKLIPGKNQKTGCCREKGSKNGRFSVKSPKNGLPSGAQQQKNNQKKPRTQNYPETSFLFATPYSSIAWMGAKKPLGFFSVAFPFQTHWFEMTILNLYRKIRNFA